jgi:hypothetical protein
MARLSTTPTAVETSRAGMTGLPKVAVRPALLLTIQEVTAAATMAPTPPIQVARGQKRPSMLATNRPLSSIEIMPVM